MTANETTPSSYRVHFSWPFQLVPPTLVVVALGLPALIRFVELRAISLASWLTAAGFVIGAIAWWVHFGRTVEVSPAALDFRGRMRTRRLEWRDVASYKLDGDSLVVTSADGRSHRVDVFMKNCARLYQDLEARLAPIGGSSRERPATGD